MIKKYTFISPFSTTISVGGIVGRSTYTKKVGDIVEGNYFMPKGDELSKVQPMVKINLLPKGALPIQGAQSSIDIPANHLKEVDSTLQTPIKLGVSKESVEKNKLVSFIPFLLGSSGLAFAYYKKLTPIQYALLIGGGLILGYGIKNQITYGNLIGWR
jgi:hypothetical protein